MVKRSSSATSSDADTKHHIDNDHPSSPSPLESESNLKPTKKQKTTKANKDKSEKQVRNRVAWTAEEDAIYLELVETIIKDNIWATVKADGRLVHRKHAGIAMHIPSIMRNLKGSK